MRKYKFLNFLSEVFIGLVVIATFGAFCDILLRGVIFKAIPSGLFLNWDFLGRSVVAIFVVLAITSTLIEVIFLLKKRNANDKRLFFVWFIGLNTATALLIITFLPFNDYLFPSYSTLSGILINLGWVLFVGIVGAVSGLLTNHLYKKKYGFVKPLFISLSIISLILTAISFFVYDGIPKEMQGEDIDGPNILVISIDALRRDYVSAYNESYVETPNLDSFAERGYRFEYSYSNSPWTLPSMMTMCTGQYPSVHGIAFGKLPADLPTVAEALKGHGYRTEAYTGNGIMKREYGFEKGFDKYLLHTEDDWYYPFRNTPVGRILYQINKKTPSSLKIGKQIDSTTWCSDILVERIGTLHSNDQPYFLWVHIMDPHTPLTPPIEYIERPEREAEKLWDFGLSNTVGHDEENFNVKYKDDLVDLYAAEVRYVDDALKPVLEALDGLNVWEDTLIILTADHGEEHFEHGKYGHTRTLYDETTAVPLIIHFPDKKSGVVENPSSIIDIPTTILSYVGSDKIGLTDGNDLYTYLDGSILNNGKYVYADRTDKDLGACSIRDDEFLLIHYTLDIEDLEIEKDRWELYRYKQDPYLADNVAKFHPEKTSEFRAILLDFKADLNRKKSELGNTGNLKLSNDDRQQLHDLGYF